jgi:hypothetical protein
MVIFPFIFFNNQICDEPNRKELVDLGGAKDWESVCGGVRGAGIHVHPLPLPSQYFNYYLIDEFIHFLPIIK